ncbi:nucleotide sugar dehydrogenase [Cellulosimicrobium cellulans]|uniref:nucleotide sugar dehydrogenase n=1 Tax=Cellulosimicrobium cellulans TaxID=1710 RepID=UPI001BAC0A66|nr:nucleotide sugar dehydrogenase [Cellulosimicrobium cellulans]QUC00597.1 nucleotide sugar dehydrogenase [Cellulosimicrobium cellulans]
MSALLDTPSGPVESGPTLRKVAVVGLGYVGRPLALELYRHGHHVVGYDLTAGRRTQAARDAATVTPREGARFRTVRSPAALRGCDAFVVAVPTPVGDDDRPDLSAVEAACRDVGGALAPGSLVSFESTVHPGVTRGVCVPILEERSGLVAGRDFHVAFSPERIAPGEVGLTEVVKVVGGLDEASSRAAWDLYEPVVAAGLVAVSSLEAAELTKLVENGQRDVNIAFMNEVNEYAHALGVDLAEVLAACRTKWSFKDFRPGLVGGHCIAVDPYYLLDHAASIGVDMTATASARATNARYHQRLADRIEALVAGRGERPRVVVYGTTYKPDVDDTRNSGPLRLAAHLRERGFDVTTLDRLVDDPAHVAAVLAGPRSSRLVVVAVVHAAHRARLAGDLDVLAGEDGPVVSLTPAAGRDVVPERLELTALL